MKTTYRPACARRSVKPATDVVSWACRLVADPARYGATERERRIVAELLAQAVSR